jgi:hypothetical protein
MRDYFYLGSTPCDEACVQVEPTGHYIDAMRAEVQRDVEMLRVRFPQAIEYGVGFRAKAEQHDFGIYYEAVAIYDDSDQEALDFACWIEDNLPDTWADDQVLHYVED